MTGEMMLRWLHREARWLAIADDGALMGDHGADRLANANVT
jgi:hypothetical protein